MRQGETHVTATALNHNNIVGKVWRGSGKRRASVTDDVRVSGSEEDAVAGPGGVEASDSEIREAGVSEHGRCESWEFQGVSARTE